MEDGKSNAQLDATWRMPIHKIVISKWLVEVAQEKFGDTMLSHVPNSVDLEQFHAEPRESPGPDDRFALRHFLDEGMSDQS